MRRENAVAPTQLIASSQLTLDQWIESQLLPAVAAEHLAAEASAFDAPASFDATVAWTRPDIGAGQVPLPSDFLRLVAFKMSDWSMAAHTVAPLGSDAYLRQASAHAGVRGNPSRPVCAIVPSAQGLQLEFYSCLSTDATIEQALYVPAPTIAADGTIDIAPSCYHPVIARLANP